MTTVTDIARYEEEQRTIARLRELPNGQTPAGKAALDDWEGKVRTKLDRLYREDLALAVDVLALTDLNPLRVRDWQEYKAILEDKLTVLGLTAELDAIDAMGAKP